MICTLHGAGVQLDRMAGKSVKSWWMNLRLYGIRRWRELVARSLSKTEAVSRMSMLRVEGGIGTPSSLLPDKVVAEDRKVISLVRGYGREEEKSASVSRGVRCGVG